MKRIKNPTIPNKEPPEVIRTTSAKTETIINTGTTPIIPFLTTLFPEFVLEKSPNAISKNIS